VADALRFGRLDAPGLGAEDGRAKHRHQLMVDYPCQRVFRNRDAISIAGVIFGQLPWLAPVAIGALTWFAVVCVQNTSSQFLLGVSRDD
jgi:hypothetical protein